MGFGLTGRCQVDATVNLVSTVVYLVQLVHLNIVHALRIYIRFLEINLSLCIFKPEQQQCTVLFRSLTSGPSPLFDIDTLNSVTFVPPVSFICVHLKLLNCTLL